MYIMVSKNNVQDQADIIISKYSMSYWNQYRLYSNAF